MITLYESGDHRCYMFNDFSTGSMIQANQHIIVHGEEAVMLDPGGHKIHTKLFAEMASIVPMKNLKHIFFSHQDPDIVAAANAWLMMTDATAYLSQLWIHFIPHFGIDELVINRITPVPDEGGFLTVGGLKLTIAPAHFLHSSGNFHLYDPVSKILFTGDLGASIGHDYDFVDDFDAHIQYMEGFHRRYMPSSKALQMWAAMARTLDIEMIAPQHGAIFRGRELSLRFIDWIDNFQCGADVMGEAFEFPK